MDMFQPVGPVQHSGTFNAHLVPVLAGVAFMKEAAKPYFYRRLQELEDRFHRGVEQIIQDHDLNLVVPHHGARFNILLGRRTPALRYEETFCHRREVFLSILRACWEKGVYFHDYGGSPAHHGYSIQHSVEEIDQVLDVLEAALVQHRADP
jgi:glutamate-1-semialdehyde aminotransferase